MTCESRNHRQKSKKSKKSTNKRRKEKIKNIKKKKQKIKKKKRCLQGVHSETAPKNDLCFQVYEMFQEIVQQLRPKTLKQKQLNPGPQRSHSALQASYLSYNYPKRNRFHCIFQLSTRSFHNLLDFFNFWINDVSILSCTMSVKNEHEHDDHITSRLQPPQQKGWRTVAESSWTLWHSRGSREGHPRYTRARTRQGCGWPDNKSPRDTTKTKTRPSLQRHV